MRTLLTILLFATSLCYAQPAITNPTPLSVCDNDSNGLSVFNLTSKNAEILGSLLASNHTVSYHETLTDATTGFNSLGSTYNNINPFNQVVYVRVIENSDPANPSTAVLELVVNQSPVISPMPVDVIVCESYTLPALQSNENYYTGPNGTGSLIPAGVTITSTQTIYIFAQSGTNPICTAEESFTVTIDSSLMVIPVFPTPATVCQGTQVTYGPTSTNGIIGNWNPAFISYDTPPGIYTLTFTPLPDQCAESVTMNVTVNEIPTANLTSNMSLPDSPYDGIATFDLTQQTNTIIGSQSNISISFFSNLSDANNGINEISNPISYNNISNPQLIGVRVTNDLTGCFTTTFFSISVVNPNPNIINFTDASFKNNLLSASPLNYIAFSSGIPVKIDQNNDFEIQYSEAAVIDSLNVNYNGSILDINGIEGFTNIKRFRGAGNKISNFNLNTNTLLEFIDISGNLFTSINATGLTNLKQLFCAYNLLTSINVTGLTNLEILNCPNNLLTNLDLSSLQSIKELYCGTNNLTTLNTSGLLNLEHIQCIDNQLTTLNISTLTNLISLDCSFNQLTSLDATNNSNLSNINFYSNQLVTLFIKNGVLSTGIEIGLNPTLQFVCCDEINYTSIQSNVEYYGYTNCTVNSYCSFTPGGNYNTLTGTATFDINNNGCDTSDIPFDLLGLNVSLNGVSPNSSVFTNNAGVYNLYTNVVGEYQLTPNFENPTYFNVSPGVQLFPVIDNSTATQNICIVANGIHPDLEIVIAPINPARPGFDALYQIVYKNKGNQTLSGSYTFNYDDSKLDFISATVMPNTLTFGNLTWNFTNLLPFENRTIYVTLNVNSPVEIPAVNIGDVFTFSSTINPITGDETPSDNAFTYAQTVVGSYDPNDITCLEGETVSPSEIGEYLHYMVNFENTGNYYAENVVVKIEIDETKYDINSLQLLNTSHENKSKITNNIVEFIFEDINLVAASGNPPVGGHGNVLFKIKSKDNLVSGDMVQKAAKIYFDYNAPIETNISQTTYQSLTNPIFDFDESVKIYPNPTNGIININSNFNIKSIELYDVQGRILEKSFENNTTTTLNLSNRQSGIYFVKITSDKGSKVEKVVKN